MQMQEDRLPLSDNHALIVICLKTGRRRVAGLEPEYGAQVLGNMTSRDSFRKDTGNIFVHPSSHIGLPYLEEIEVFLA
jgi:hypothetical protein